MWPTPAFLGLSGGNAVSTGERTAGAQCPAAEIWNLMTTAVLAADREGGLLWGNGAAEMLLGRSVKSFAGESFETLLPECAEWFRHLSVDDGMLSSAIIVGSMLKSLQGGLPGHVRVQAVLTPVSGHTSGALPEGTAAVIEIIDVEETLRQDREDAATGLIEANRQLLRNLAHEIKNPLGGIRGAAQLLEGELTRDEDRECTGIIIEEADRLQALVDRFLAPYRQGEAREEVNVHEVLEHVKSLMTLEFPSGLTFVRDYDISAPTLTGDRARLTQVFLNLVRNAAEAMETERRLGTAVITLRTRIVRDVLAGAERTRRALAVDVIDNGPGVPEDMQEKIFYPLVTGRAEGSGLGLSLAQTFVRQAGGSLTLESVPGKTVFRVLLPLGRADA